MEFSHGPLTWIDKNISNYYFAIMRFKKKWLMELENMTKTSDFSLRLFQQSSFSKMRNSRCNVTRIVTFVVVRVLNANDPGS